MTVGWRCLESALCLLHRLRNGETLGKAMVKMAHPSGGHCVGDRPQRGQYLLSASQQEGRLKGQQRRVAFQAGGGGAAVRLVPIEG